MGLPTNEEQQEILDWYDAQRSLSAQAGTTTDRIKKSLIQILRDLSIIEKLDITADDAHKAWTTAQRLEKRLQRAFAAANSSYQMDVKE